MGVVQKMSQNQEWILALSVGFMFILWIRRFLGNRLGRVASWWFVGRNPRLQSAYKFCFHCRRPLSRWRRLTSPKAYCNDICERVDTEHIHQSARTVLDTEAARAYTNRLRRELADRVPLGRVENHVRTDRPWTAEDDEFTAV